MPTNHQQHECDDRLLHGYLEDALSNEQQLRVENHLCQCQRCRNLISDSAAEEDWWSHAGEYLRGDPWDALFKIAKQRLRENGLAESDLMPFWIFEDVDDPARVERIVPLPPFSSENAKFKALKKSLAVYRLAFGQPRQEDLIEFLADARHDRDDQLLKEMQLNLDDEIMQGCLITHEGKICHEQIRDIINQ